MFHKNLLRIRTCNNYTVEQVAKKMNISPELYEKWESGEVVPTVDVLPPTLFVLRLLLMRCIYGHKH